MLFITARIELLWAESYTAHLSSHKSGTPNNLTLIAPMVINICALYYVFFIVRVYGFSERLAAPRVVIDSMRTATLIYGIVALEKNRTGGPGRFDDGSFRVTSNST